MPVMPRNHSKRALSSGWNFIRANVSLPTGPGYNLWLYALISSIVTTINTSSVSAAVPVDGFAAAMARFASSCRAEATKYAWSLKTRGDNRNRRVLGVTLLDALSSD
jgi:hypothetical protein